MAGDSGDEKVKKVGGGLSHRRCIDRAGEAEGSRLHLLLSLGRERPVTGACGKTWRSAGSTVCPGDHSGRRGPIIQVLIIPYDPEDQAFAAIRQFERFELGIQLFARSVRPEVKLGGRTLFLDPTDL